MTRWPLAMSRRVSAPEPQPIIGFGTFAILPVLAFLTMDQASKNVLGIRKSWRPGKFPHIGPATGILARTRQQLAKLRLLNVDTFLKAIEFLDPHITQ